MSASPANGDSLLADDQVAFPDGKGGKTTVEFRKIAEQFHLKVSDDGAGLPTDHDLRRSNSLGINLVNGLVRQLEGNIGGNFMGIGEHEVPLSRNVRAEVMIRLNMYS